ncbi:MAG: sugar-binding transcriptional regulator [Anaerostipes sp.]|nr:sugar-binding transcriptional regulator [Anaerostipes sp.]MDD5969467.1 sugar-binding transcriptional regulator [Anaerostipes sp.]
MKRRDERFLMKVADMYYRDELSQDMIASKLNISRTTVSRALTSAKQAGYIKIVFDFPTESSVEIEKQIEKKYNIKEAGVALVNNPSESKYEVSKTAARYLARVLKNNMVVGLTWGRTMKRLIDAFDEENLGKTLKIKGVQVVPFLGTNSPSSTDNDYLRLTYSSLLSSKLAELIRGINYSLPAPMYVKNPELYNLLIQEPEISITLKKATQCQVALIGIGLPNEDSAIGCLDEEKAQMLRELKKEGGVGEILGRVFDQNGQTIHSDFDQKIIGLSLEDLQKIPTRVGIAYGTKKIEAIKVALQSGLINVLITDHLTAQELLNE